MSVPRRDAKGIMQARHQVHQRQLMLPDLSRIAAPLDAVQSFAIVHDAVRRLIRPPVKRRGHVRQVSQPRALNEYWLMVVMLDIGLEGVNIARRRIARGVRGDDVG